MKQPWTGLDKGVRVLWESCLVVEQITRIGAYLFPLLWLFLNVPAYALVVDLKPADVEEAIRFGEENGKKADADRKVIGYKARCIKPAAETGEFMPVYVNTPWSTLAETVDQATRLERPFPISKRWLLTLNKSVKFLWSAHAEGPEEEHVKVELQQGNRLILQQELRPSDPVPNPLYSTQLLWSYIFSVDGHRIDQSSPIIIRFKRFVGYAQTKYVYEYLIDPKDIK